MPARIMILESRTDKAKTRLATQVEDSSMERKHRVLVIHPDTAEGFPIGSNRSASVMKLLNGVLMNLKVSRSGLKRVSVSSASAETTTVAGTYVPSQNDTSTCASN